MRALEKKVALALVLGAACLATVAKGQKVTIISSTCMTLVGGQTDWISCPLNSTRRAESWEEFRDNILSNDDEQKFCCGDVESRYCCSLTQKRAESPAFDPETYQQPDGNASQDERHHYLFHQHTSTFKILTILTCIIFLLFLVGFVFGNVLLMLLDLLCCLLCCCRRRGRHPDPKQNGYYDRYSDNERTILVEAGRVQQRPAPRAYNATPHRVSRDLYANRTASSSTGVDAPPAYEVAAAAAAVSDLPTTMTATDQAAGEK